MQNVKDKKQDKQIADKDVFDKILDKAIHTKNAQQLKNRDTTQLSSKTKKT